MRLQLAPLERRNGHWRLNFWSLFAWMTVFNLAVMAALHWWHKSPSPRTDTRPVPARAMKHPVAVIGQEVRLLAAASDTAKQLKSLRRGDTVDLYVAQPAGWFFVTLPDAGTATYDRSRVSYQGGMAGYVRQELLQVPDSVLRNIRQQR